MGAAKKTSDKVLYPELSYALQGAFYEVYNVLGPGFREETYRQALERIPLWFTTSLPLDGHIQRLKRRTLAPTACSAVCDHAERTGSKKHRKSAWKLL